MIDKLVMINYYTIINITINIKVIKIELKNV